MLLVSLAIHDILIVFLKIPHKKLIGTLSYVIPFYILALDTGNIAISNSGEAKCCRSSKQYVIYRFTEKSSFISYNQFLFF